MEPSTVPDDSAVALAALAPAARAPSARARLGVGAAIVLFIVALVAAVLISALSGGGIDEAISPVDSTALGSSGEQDGVVVSTSEATTAPILLVHVWGAIANAGLYELKAGARVVDVVAAAGGFADDADPAGVNLARALEDGEQLHVPRLGEVPPPAVSAPGPSSPGAATGTGALLNLNTATPAELEMLPRIGPAMSQRIVEWRDANGGFSSVDDLRNVSGIGEKTFEGLKELVTT